MPELSFHLVFRGEVLEGQQQAVVAKRLAALLKMDPAKAGALFSGKPIALKRNASEAVAAKYQTAFRQAGARLRVVPVEGDAAGATSASMVQAVPAKKMPLAERLAAAEAAKVGVAGSESAAPSNMAAVAGAGSPAAATVPDDAPGVDAFSLAPATGDLLSEYERPRITATEIDVSHLSAAPACTGSLEDIAEHPPPLPAPDVSGISLAEAGAVIGPEREKEIASVPIPNIDLAEVGAVIETLAAPPPPLLPDVQFEVAEVGADIDPEIKPPPPQPPDVSHIRLASEGRASFSGAD